MTNTFRWRRVGIVCAVLWLFPVVGFVVLALDTWFGDTSVSEDPHGYVAIGTALFALPVAAFAGSALRSLWLLVLRRPGAGMWMVIVGSLGGFAGVALLPGVLMSWSRSELSEMETSPSPLVLSVTPMVLAVITIVAATKLMGAARPAPPLPTARLAHPTTQPGRPPSGPGH